MWNSIKLLYNTTVSFIYKLLTAVRMQVTYCWRRPHMPSCTGTLPYRAIIASNARHKTHFLLSMTKLKHFLITLAMKGILELMLMVNILIAILHNSLVSVKKCWYLVTPVKSNKIYLSVFITKVESKTFLECNDGGRKWAEIKKPLLDFKNNIFRHVATK